MFQTQFQFFKHIYEGTRHKHYDHWVDYKDTVKALITGEGSKKLLNQFVPREDADLFEQRDRINKKITIGVSSRTQAPFKRALRNDETQKNIEPIQYAGQDEDYFKGLTVEEYTKEYLSSRVMYDPHAWLVIDWIDFDERTEKARSYPFIVGCQDVVDFHENKTGDVEWLMIENMGSLIMYNKAVEYSFINSEGQRQEANEVGLTYRMTPIKELPKGRKADFDFKKFYELLKDGKASENEQEFIESGSFIEIKENTYFFLESFDPNIEGNLQAKQLGYLLDAGKDQEGFVSPLHPCVERLKAIFDTASEMFITKAFHAFPQKIQRGVRCEGDGKHMCHSGTVRIPQEEGEDKIANCKSCGGSGIKLLPGTSAETLIVPLGDDKDDTLPLSEVATYIKLDIEVMKFQDEFIKDQSEECLKDMYARSAFSVNTAQQTATESNLNEESVDDVLYPFTQWFSQIYSWQIKLRGLVNDETIESVEYSFPSTLQMRSRSEAITEFKNSEGAPFAVIQATREEIVRKQFKDNPEERKKHLSRMQFEPLQGKTESEKQFLISQGAVLEADVFLLANSSRVWCEVESKDPQFYDKTYELQKGILNEVIEEMMPQTEITLPNLDDE